MSPFSRNCRIAQAPFDRLDAARRAVGRAHRHHVDDAVRMAFLDLSSSHGRNGPFFGAASMTATPFGAPMTTWPSSALEPV